MEYTFSIFGVLVLKSKFLALEKSRVTLYAVCDLFKIPIDITLLFLMITFALLRVIFNGINLVAGFILFLFTETLKKNFVDFIVEICV
jgi:hypothetical protein